MRKFKATPSPHSRPPEYIQMAIRVNDLSTVECAFLESIILNGNSESDDYKICSDAGAFLQHCTPPFEHNAKNGRVLIEFWTNNTDKVTRCVEHINSRFEKISEYEQMFFEENL